MDAVELATIYPRLYHMAEPGSWPSIKVHGLLSTTALLDLFEIGGPSREAIELKYRPDSVPIVHPRHGTATIRDQKPMDDRGLSRALRDGLTPTEWYGILNRKVFFWLATRRLAVLLGARAYRGRRQTVLTIDTQALLARHASRVMLSPMNSGATKPMPHPRGRTTFVSIDDCPFSDWKRTRGRAGAVVELTVDHAVPDVRDFVLRVDEVGGDTPLKNLVCVRREPAPYGS